TLDAQTDQIIEAEINGLSDAYQHQGLRGLADTVVDCNASTRTAGTANGFSFTGASVPGLLAAVARAIEAWRDPPLWRELQRNGMARDWGWSTAARRYAQLYRSLRPGDA
ncbi:MAG: hypothetical protein J0H00_22490, partial [Burkholderiales bacterium]|nr:hypothetical protein [Burkholderiales bacterium]